MEETKKLLVRDYSRSSQSDVYYTSEKYPGFLYHTSFHVTSGWTFNMCYKNVCLTSQPDLMVNGDSFADKKEYVINNFVDAAESFLHKDVLYKKVKENYEDWLFRNNSLEVFPTYSKEDMLLKIMTENF